MSVPARLQVTGLFQEGQQRPADVFVPAGALGLYQSRDAIMDVTLTNPTSGAAISNGSHRSSLSAALKAESNKRSPFRAAAQRSGGVWSHSAFVPLAFETTGAMGPSMQELFLHLVKVWTEIKLSVLALRFLLVCLSLWLRLFY